RRRAVGVAQPFSPTSEAPDRRVRRGLLRQSPTRSGSTRPATSPQPTCRWRRLAMRFAIRLTFLGLLPPSPRLPAEPTRHRLRRRAFHDVLPPPEPRRDLPYGRAPA